MIKKVVINKLGRFEKFSFDGVDDFKRYNILYGLNYSGKTTLSRAFMLFDTKKVPEHYEDGYDFYFVNEDGSKVLSDNQTDINTFQTKVFNSDYIENNLFFKTSGASNILVLAENAQEIMSKIEQLENEIKIKNNEIKSFEQQQNEYQAYIDKRRTDESKKIKENLHTTFTATTFQSYEKNIKINEDIHKFIIENDNELVEKRSIAIAEKNKDNISEIPLIPEINTEPLKILLNEVVDIRTPLKRLEENKVAESWVREGLSLHKNQEICFYCGQPLNNDILNELNAHFNHEYNELISKIETEQRNFKTISRIENLPDTSKFYNQFENKYLKDKDILETRRKEYNKEIKKIQDALTCKLKSITKPITFETDFKISTLNDQIKIINNGVINDHNTFNTNFEKQKENALEELKIHYVATTIIGKDYTDAEKYVKEAKDGIECAKKEIEAKEKEKLDLETKISESVAGAEKINKILNRLFMGKSDITILNKTGENKDKYILMRNNEPAHNLSEGEKTAISFAHFIASLESKDLIGYYGNITLFIDDPISSLDNNHIYAVYSEIERLRKEECSNITGSDKRKYKQLFISTHNYNLFRLLTERDEKYIGVYYIQRTSQTSEIINFPKTLLQQKAEYSFLFNQIKKYISAPTEEDYIIGHFLRRFLEIFATYKNPTKCDLRKRLEDIVSLKEEYKSNETLIQAVYKMVNEESHTYITNEIIDNGNLKNTAESVLKFVELIDPEQYSFLEKNYNN